MVLKHNFNICTAFKITRLFDLFPSLLTSHLSLFAHSLLYIFSLPNEKKEACLKNACSSKNSSSCLKAKNTTLESLTLGMNKLNSNDEYDAVDGKKEVRHSCEMHDEKNAINPLTSSFCSLLPFFLLKRSINS